MKNTKNIPLLKELNAGEEYRRLNYILGKQCVHTEMLKTFESIAKRWFNKTGCTEAAINNVISRSLIVYNSIYNYGVMQGKRQERAKKKAL